MKKRCTECSLLKEFILFYNDSRHSDGKMSRCAECHKKGCNIWRNANRSLSNGYDRNVRKNNPNKTRWDNAKRRAAKLHRTPKWLTKKELLEIKQFYLSCPKGYEVDHIIPLRGKNISGLHVLDNLQYLTKTDNRRKANK